jgi:starch-binding outer membrane protein, SusD/RagB family
MSLLRNTTRAARYGALLAVPMGLMVACTDLKETPTSLITKDTFYKNTDEVLAGLAAVYANLRNQYEDHYAVQQVSSEETVVPTRGSDWFDNGAWLELHRQGWTPTSVVGLREVNAIWNQMYTGVARANIVLEALETVTIPNKAAVVAELRALRAMFYMNLLDNYGGVPIATTTKVEARARKTATETFTFIETELKAARADLPKTWPNEYGRITQGAADAMLASLYLNAQTYTGTVSSTGLAKGTARWADALASADLVLNSGTYSLEPNIRTNFAATNQNSKENIFVVRAVAADGLGFRRQWQSLHYNSVSPGDGGWNGWAVVAETYRKFDAADDRRKLILIGNQTAISDPTKQVFDRQGNPLVFTIDIADITAANEAEGPRNYKYPVDPAKAGTWNGNDYAIYRLGEIMLIKAEALNELGRTPEAVAVVNTLRARSFSPAKPITASTQADVRAAIFNERLFELYAEGKHRTDQIRQGTYTSGAWFGKTANTPAFKVLLPIPKPQLDVNPLLTQNPGY